LKKSSLCFTVTPIKHNKIELIGIVGVAYVIMSLILMKPMTVPDETLADSKLIVSVAGGAL